jgi:hypothetical protein
LPTTAQTARNNTLPANFPRAFRQVAEKNRLAACAPRKLPRTTSPTTGHQALIDYRVITAAEQGEVAASGEASELDAADWAA